MHLARPLHKALRAHDVLGVRAQPGGPLVACNDCGALEVKLGVRHCVLEVKLGTSLDLCTTEFAVVARTQLLEAMVPPVQQPARKAGRVGDASAGEQRLQHDRMC